MARGKDAELDKFLRNVDEVDSIIRGLSSNDSSASEKADEFLQRYQRNMQVANADGCASVDRTVVNDEAFKNWDSSRACTQQQTAAAVDAASFMAAMEADCRERAESRKVNECIAEKLKLDGNEAFNAGDYVKAVELYTEALAHMRQCAVLYTNRAQAYLRLDQFEAALEDCRWAFKVDDKCLKAAILEGRAHVGLKQYGRAIECYNKAKEIDARKERLVNDYIDRARISEAADRAEKSARQTFEASTETGPGLVSLLDKLNKPAQPTLYYIGGLQVVRQKLSEPLARTLFRCSGGFELADSHCEISRCLECEPSRLGLSASDVQLAALYVLVLRDACVDDDENQCRVLAMKHLVQQVMTFIESVAYVPACRDVAAASVDLLLYLSQTARNRSSMVVQYDAVRLISAAFVLAGRLQDADAAVAVNTQRLICNLATTDRLRRALRDDFEESVVASFNSLLTSDSALTRTPGATLSVKTMVNLCGDDWLRSRLSDNETTWSASIRALTRVVDQDQHESTELLLTLVSLLANMAINGTSRAVHRDVVQLSELCTDLVTQSAASHSPQLVDRCYLLLSRVLKAGSDCVEAAVRKELIRAVSRDLIHLLDGGKHQQQQQRHDAEDREVTVTVMRNDETELVRHCVAALTVCTLRSELSRHQLTHQLTHTQTKTDSRPSPSPSVIGLLVKLVLRHQSYDDVLIGNVALCLSQCVHLTSAVHQLTAAAAETDSDVMMTLLVLARDQAKPTVQHNCAILIAKLVRQHEPFLDRLRQLHGLEILHSVVKHVEQ